MIKKYSEGKINEVVVPSEDDKDKFIKKTEEALNNDQDIIKKEAAKEDKPFWINK